MDSLAGAIPHQSHKRSNSRVKTEKKKKKDLERKGIKGKQARHNPKAFSFSGGRHAVHRRVQHASEVEERRLRRPRVFKAAEVPPPFVVVVQGPAGVGKTTLIQSLVKHYAKRNVAAVKGPITLVSSKERRLTLIECGSSMVDMLDCCKVADLVLLMIDCSFGYEMETLEFLNIMQTHGFPRVVAVVTHMEGFPDNSVLRKVKKRLKNRFWAEIYDGAKMVYLNGLKYGRYKKNEIVNVARAIASQKPTTISWRQSHFYCVCLRHEVLGPTSGKDSGKVRDNSGKAINGKGEEDGDEASVRVSFYGYVYGSRIVGKQALHIPGVGDFIPESVTNMQDPCPVQTEGRTLKDKNRNIYAPECDVGNVMLDDDAMYIQLARAKEHFTEIADEGPIQSEAVKMVRELQKSEDALKSQLRSYKFKPVGSADARTDNEEGSDSEGDDSDDEDEEGDYDVEDGYSDDENGDASDDEDENEDEDDENDENEDDDENEDESEDDADDVEGNISQKLKNRTRSRRNDHEGASDGDSSDSDGVGYNDLDGAFSSSEDESDASVETEEEREALSNLTDEIATKVYGTEAVTPYDLVFTDFSRLEDDKFDMDWTEEAMANLRSECFQNYTDEAGVGADEAAEAGVADNDPENEKLARIEEAEQKRLYNEALALSSVGNVGQFVRITVNGLPHDFLKHRDANRGRPIIIGGLQMGEQSSGYIQVKLRKHRWAPRVLKTNDPLLFSIGWRRFQSLPVYCMDERNNTRIKMLKYTPEHMHCLANLYAPLAPPSLGVVAIKDWSRVPHYRISATGVVVGTNQEFNIKKKLKVQGYPYKIMKNTAFIKDMFTSELEVIKCQGSRIVTASGIRGEIKKPVGKNGSFRATFEDKILMSDLVLLKAFVSVRTKRFFNPMVDWEAFRRVRTMAELRTESGINPDSVYEPKALLRRPTRRFNAIRIPKPILEKLPFSSRPKVYESEPSKETMGHSEYESAVAAVMQRLMTIRKSRLEKRKADQEKHKAKLMIEEEKRVEASKERLKNVKKQRYMKRGMAEAAKRAKMCLD
ncbi:ribosome biogenesis BMS1 homolog [Babesia ovata]|uniref:Ribosome biogenesis BMS1 homolog n=1 Tax=Babesia ovata TaxID=189622 RepID=A0A2H6K8H8_9APIC|nr:ribosome biogenesis BMS1 homolog [Babesia ovata]GBE59312.1 ribosome biogenesis BMS1 homolog [Babesia ovata]